MDISASISESLILTPNHQYKVNSNTNEETFQHFLKYLVDDEIPDINIDNINDYIRLSEEFHLLNEIIQNKKEQLGEYLININGISELESDTSNFEKQIAINLDQYLINHGDRLMKAPIQSLFNVFNHSQRVLTEHNLAYDLIASHFKKTGDSNIFILLDTLDGTKLSKSNLQDSILKKEERMNHIPKIEFSFLAKAIELQQKLELQIENFAKEKIDWDEVVEKDRRAFNDMNENYKKEMNEMRESNKQALTETHADQKKELNEMNEKNKQVMIEMRKSYLNEANEIHKKEKDEITKSFEKDKKELINYFENQIEKLELKHSQEIVALKNRIDSLEKLLNGEKKEELSNKNKGKSIIECKFEGDELCGIISYMKKTFGDVLKFSDAGTSSAMPTVNLFSYDTNNINEIYENQTSGKTSESNGWVEVDFGEQKVSLESYTIRSGNFSANRYSHPKSWRISGSNDRSHWEIISHMVNCSLLNGSYKQHRFECENSQKFYRYIRYIQEDSWSEDYKFNIRLTCLELFGSILG